MSLVPRPAARRLGPTAVRLNEALRDLELVTIGMSSYETFGGFERARALDDLARAERPRPAP